MAEESKGVCDLIDTLTVRDVAAIFGVTEKSVFDWARKGTFVPVATRDPIRFRRSLVIAWAKENGRKIHAEKTSEIKE